MNCEGRRASDHSQRCPRQAKWRARFGESLDPLLLCDYHKGNIDAFPSFYVGVTAEALDLRPAQPAAAPTKG